jgi:hypothetical protein
MSVTPFSGRSALDVLDVIAEVIHDLLQFLQGDASLPVKKSGHLGLIYFQVLADAVSGYLFPV